MKFLYTLLLAVFCFNVGISQSVKRPLITKRTATWCPNCGAWGWTFMKDVINEVESDALVIATHFSGELQDPLNQDIADAFGGSGQPQFFLNGENQGANANNTADKLVQIREKVSQINEENAEFEIQLSAEYGTQDNGDYALYANANVLVENPLNDGTYTLGVYLVRDDINAIQSGQSGTVDHFKILAGNFTESSFGPEISSESGTGGEITFVLFHNTDIDLERSQVAVIIWKDIDGQKEVVNTLSADFSEIISDNIDISTSSTIAYQMGDRSIHIESSTNIQDVKLIDYSGRLIMHRQTDSKAINIQASNISEGHYVLLIQTKDGTLRKQIFIR